MADVNSLKQIGSRYCGASAETGDFVSLVYSCRRLFSVLLSGRFFWFLLLIIGVVSTSSCSLNHEETWEKLQELEGQWVSEGPVLVNQHWVHRNDETLEGFLYAAGPKDTLLIENYSLMKIKDSLYFQLGDDSIQRLRLEHASRTQISFFNEFRSYPNRIVLHWESDSVVVFRKENLRGNMPIEFRLERDDVRF